MRDEQKPKESLLEYLLRHRRMNEEELKTINALLRVHNFLHSLDEVNTYRLNLRLARACTQSFHEAGRIIHHFVKTDWPEKSEEFTRLWHDR